MHYSFKSVSDKFNVTELHPIATSQSVNQNNDEIVNEVKMKLVLILKSYPKKTKLTMVTQLLTLLKLKTEYPSTSVAVQLKVTLFKDKELFESHSFLLVS